MAFWTLPELGGIEGSHEEIWKINIRAFWRKRDLITSRGGIRTPESESSVVNGRAAEGDHGKSSWSSSGLPSWECPVDWRVLDVLAAVRHV